MYRFFKLKTKLHLLETGIFFFKKSLKSKELFQTSLVHILNVISNSDRNNRLILFLMSTIRLNK